MRRASLLLVLALVAAACGGTAASETGAGVRVLAAASLTDAFEDLAGATFLFAGSQALVRQVQDGSPADVIATADMASMQVLLDAGLVEKPVVFATNRLTIAVAPGNPEQVDGLADLARDDLVTVLADPSVPAGTYAAEALRKAGVSVRARSYELDVKAALTKVTTGEADAAIVYVTDVQAAGDDADTVDIPGEHNVRARYPVAVIEGQDETAGRAFVRRLLGPEGRQALGARGFGRPS